jgi:hypothetical protein
MLSIYSIYRLTICIITSNNRFNSDSDLRVSPSNHWLYDVDHSPFHRSTKWYHRLYNILFTNEKRKRCNFNTDDIGYNNDDDTDQIRQWIAINIPYKYQGKILPDRDHINSFKHTISNNSNDNNYNYDISNNYNANFIDDYFTNLSKKTNARQYRKIKQITLRSSIQRDLTNINMFKLNNKIITDSSYASLSMFIKYKNNILNHKNMTLVDDNDMYKLIQCQSMDECDILVYFKDLHELLIFIWSIYHPSDVILNDTHIDEISLSFKEWIIKYRNSSSRRRSTDNQKHNNIHNYNIKNSKAIKRTSDNINYHHNLRSDSLHDYAIEFNRFHLWFMNLCTDINQYFESCHQLEQERINMIYDETFSLDNVLNMF